MTEQTPIFNFKQINNRVAIGGQVLDNLQYAQLREEGFEAIIQIDIQDDEYSQSNEQFFSQLNHMDYGTMNISLSSLSHEKVSEFFQLMEKFEDKKVYVHCTAGLYTSLLMVIYQMVRQGLDLETAIEKYTVNNWTLKSQWHAFINRVVPVQLSSADRATVAHAQ